MPDNDGQFKLYDPFGNVIMHGSMSAVTECIVDSQARADVAAEMAEAAETIGLLEHKEDQFRARQVRSLSDGLATLGHRLDAVEQRHAERIRQAAADEARRIQAQLDALPDPDDPDAAMVRPTGELHALEPNAPERRAQLAAAEQDQGDLPRQLTKAVPPNLGTDPVIDPSELAHGPGPPPPVAISLNEL
jgi:hypothetical protein